MTLGEGAAMFILEPLDAALARGARIYAEIVGFGMSADAHHITQPRAEGAALAMRRALEDTAQSGIDYPAGRVGYINAHGTGTPTNDAVEAAAIHMAPPANPRRISWSAATKSLTGHSIGAAGAIEATTATILALGRGQFALHPRRHHHRPAVNLDLIINESRPLAVKQRHRPLKLTRLRWPQRSRRIPPLRKLARDTIAQVTAPAISVLILTKNEQQDLPAALASVGKPC